MKLYNPFRLFSRFEWVLWLCSVTAVGAAFAVGESGNLLTLIASLIGATALIFVAKGHVLGQVLTVVFSLLYAVISLRFRYYGEMITYLGMTSPIAILSVIAWLRNPYEKGKAEVAVQRLSRGQIARMWVLTVLVTGGFHFILAAFDTSNLLMSTVSIATSFLASYLMLMRSTGYALAYAANDVVLIVLWVMATLQDVSYLPMVVCFVIFFLNDLYGFVNWSKMQKRQFEGQEAA